MPVFFLAEIEVFDYEKYHAYIERASEIVRQFGGEYIFRSDHIVPVFSLTANGWRLPRD